MIEFYIVLGKFVFWYFIIGISLAGFRGWIDGYA